MVPAGFHALLFHEPRSATVGVRFPQFPGIVTYGSNESEALERAGEALAAGLESDFERGVELPPSGRIRAGKGKKTVFVPLAPKVRIAYVLRQWRRKAGLTQQQLAGLLDISYQAYQRLERPGRANVTVTMLERIAHALKARLVLELRPGGVSQRFH